jgi:hypothetical protein
MKNKVALCAPFHTAKAEDDRIDEWDIKYIPGHNDPIKLVNFLDQYSSKTINMSCPLGIEPRAIEPLLRFDNLAIRLCSEKDFESIRWLSEKGARFFLDEPFAASSWKQLDDQISFGCCQIYLKDDLTHCLPKVYNICQKNSVGVRCVLNHVHSNGIYRGERETDWFIRPEDMEYASQYYDVFEFDCTYMNEHRDYAWSVFETLYRSYFEKERYTGNLQELNPQIKYQFNNRCYGDLYARRGECGFHCAQGSSCEMCSHHRELADTLYEKNIVVRKG